MKVMLWGGKAKTRIIIEMISEIYKGKAEIVGMFDKSLNKAPFHTLSLIHI